MFCVPVWELSIKHNFVHRTEVNIIWNLEAVETDRRQDSLLYEEANNRWVINVMVQGLQIVYIAESGVSQLAQLPSCSFASKAAYISSYYGQRAWAAFCIEVPMIDDLKWGITIHSLVTD